MMISSLFKIITLVLARNTDEDGDFKILHKYFKVCYQRRRSTSTGKPNVLLWFLLQIYIYPQLSLKKKIFSKKKYTPLYYFL